MVELSRPLILGSFFVFTIPGVLLLTSTAPAPLKTWVSSAYFVFLGGTHFFVTLTVYLQAANRAHFSSSLRNRVTYYLVPFALLAAFAALGCVGLGRVSHQPPESLKAAQFWILAFVNGFGFFHVARQSFGVQELLKAGSGGGFARYTRTWSNLFFLLLAGLQLKTYWNRQFELDAWSCAALGVAAVLGAGVVAGYRRAPKGPLAYFLLQAASSALIVWRFELYLFAFAMHYMEYHVLMAPRVFRTPLDLTRIPDRALGWLRTHRLAFAFGLLGLAAFLRYAPSAGAGEESAPARLLLNLTNGVFVAHYFIEAFIWRFGDPYYRASLAPLYLPRGSPGSSGSERS